MKKERKTVILPKLTSCRYITSLLPENVPAVKGRCGRVLGKSSEKSFLCNTDRAGFLHFRHPITSSAPNETVCTRIVVVSILRVLVPNRFCPPMPVHYWYLVPASGPSLTQPAAAITSRPSYFHTDPSESSPHFLLCCVFDLLYKDLSSGGGYVLEGVPMSSCRSGTLSAVAPVDGRGCLLSVFASVS